MEQDKIKLMLAGMLNGKATKETEYIKALGNADIKKGSKVIKEAINHTNLPSAEDLNYTPMDIKMAGKNALPPVSMEEITALMAGKKINKPTPQPPVKSKPVVNEDYYSFQEKVVFDSENDRFPSDDELHKQLMTKVGKTKSTPQMIQEGVNSIKSEISGGLNISEDKLKDIVEDMVYKVLGEIVETQNKNFDNKEQFKFLVGQTLFSGYIQKALELPKKKKK